MNGAGVHGDHNHFPFTIEVHDGLIWASHPTPDLSSLDLALAAYNLPNGEVFEREEIPTWIDFDEDGTHHFKAFVEHKEQYFGELKPREYGWEFFERAIAYFMKASQSTGLEQLLWHIITMEALLGENKTGGNRIFKGRINRILRNNNIKKNSGKMISIGDLYEFRNDLVHGKQFNDDDPVLVSHLTAAWNMARKTLLWSLHYLHAVQVGISSGEAGATAPSREHLLKFLDEYQKTQQLPKWLMSSPPVGFPFVQE